MCKAVDPVKKELVACFPKDAGLDEACFKISYDVLIVGVGSVNNTFGIQVGRGSGGHWSLAMRSITACKSIRTCIHESQASTCKKYFDDRLLSSQPWRGQQLTGPYCSVKL